MFKRFVILLIICLLMPGGWQRALAQSHQNGDFPRATGVLELPEAEQEAILQKFAVWEPSAPASATRSELPARVVNTRYLPVVGSQQTLGICGSYVIYYYLYTYAHARARGLTQRPDPAVTPQNVFSPAWGVLMAAHGNIKVGGHYIPEGAAPSSCIESILSIGALTWDEMPYSDDADKLPEDKFYRQLPSTAQMKSALRKQGLRGVRLPSFTTIEGLQRLKAFLAAGNIGVVVWENPLSANFDSYPNSSETVKVNGATIGDVNNGVYAWVSSAPGRYSSHAVTVVGYDDNKSYQNKDGEWRQGALLVVNSWGTTWGVSPGDGLESGFMWVGYDVILQGQKMRGELLSINARTEDYQPLSLGTLAMQDLTGRNWLQTINNFDAYWPGLFSVKVNNMPSAMSCTNNLYVTKGNGGTADVSAYVLDLTSMMTARFASIKLSAAMPFANQLGKIIGLNMEMRQQNESGDWESDHYEVPDVDFNVRRYSSYYPQFVADISVLQEKSVGLEGLHPQKGSCAWGDADGDGYPDLALSVTQKSGDGSTWDYINRLYRNNQQGQFFDYTDLEVPSGGNSWPTAWLWVDIDSDGDLDLVGGNIDGVHLYLNDGQGNFTYSRTLNYECPGPGALQVADFDRDGRPDLAITGSRSLGVVILYQLSPGNFTVRQIGARDCSRDLFGIAAIASAVGDLNGDGYPDLVVSGRTGPGAIPALVWYQNEDGYTFRPRLLPVGQDQNYCLDIADFDGDGCDDLLFSHGGFSQPFQTGVLRGRPDGMLEHMRVESGLPSLWGGQVLWADLNNDGRPEAIVNGIENGGFPDGLGGSYGTLGDYPRHEYYKNHTRVLFWNEVSGQFENSLIELPGYVGFNGPAIMAAADLDGDGDIDLLQGGVMTSKANYFTARGPGHEICAMTVLDSRSCGFLGNPRQNDPPAAPGNLSATPLGNGQAEFAWDIPADDKTPGPGLRYLLRLGTASGLGDLCSGVATATSRGLLLSQPIIMRRLPVGTIYWRVRAIDATGRMSPWSEEKTVQVTGSQAVPALTDPLPEEMLPQVYITVASKNNVQGYVTGGATATVGAQRAIRAYPRAGWKFSHWEGEVFSPLARKTIVRVAENATYTACFVPDYDLLHTAQAHSALRDWSGKVWAWSADDARSFVGEPGRKATDHLPALAGAQGVKWVGVNNQHTFYGVAAAASSLPKDDDWKNFMVDNLLRVVGLDNFSWWPYPAYPERSINFWSGGNSYLANYVGTSSSEHNLLTFGGAAKSMYNYTSWIVSEHSRNMTNLGIAQVAVADSFVLLLTHQAEIYAVGNNGSGQLGNGTTVNVTAISRIADMPRFLAIASGDDQQYGTAFALGLDFAGRVWVWGNKNFGQLGLGADALGQTVLRPCLLESFSSSPVTAIAAGSRHVLARTEDGKVWAWGDNRQGQCGVGQGEDFINSPREINSLNDVISIAAANEHSLALSSSGSLYGWGSNNFGQLNGQISGNLPEPTFVATFAWQGSNNTLRMSKRADTDLDGSNTTYPGMGVISPSPGEYFARDGSNLVIAAEDGERYEFSHWLGPVLESTERSTTALLSAGETVVQAVFKMKAEAAPTLTMQAEPATSGSTWPEPGVYPVPLGSEQTIMAIPDTKYNFLHWESATDLGDKAEEPKLTWAIAADMILTAKFAARNFMTTAIPNINGNMISLLDDGQISLWSRATPSAYYVETRYDFAGVRAVDVVGTYLALGTDGRLYAWGGNRNGELGQGEISSTQVSLPNYRLVKGTDGEECFTNAVAVFSTNETNFALRQDNAFFIWGKMPISRQAQTRPLQVHELPLDNPVRQVACISNGEESAYLFLLDDGTVYSWGDAIFTGTGQLHAVPQPVPSLAGIKSIAAGSGVALALTQDGQVLAWGDGQKYAYRGCLGMGPTHVSQTTPVTLPGLSDIQRIFVVSETCFAVDSQGKLFLWGSNSAWELGIGSEPICYYEPTLHPNHDLPEFVSIHGTGSHIVALTVDGQLWRWGRNAFEYRTNQSQQLHWPDAVQDKTPLEPFNQTAFTHCEVTLQYDSRLEGLINYPAGTYTFLRGDTLILHAQSSTGKTFGAWHRDGELLSEEQFLCLPVDDNFILTAEYQIASPVLQLQDTAIDVNLLAVVPLYLTQAVSEYEALDLVLRFPATMRFLGIDDGETQLQENWQTSYWPLPGQDQNGDQALVRLLLWQTEQQFSASTETPLAKLRFAVPAVMNANCQVAIDVPPASPPVLSRQRGAFADQAQISGTAAQLLASPGKRQEFPTGWMVFTPFGDSAYQSVEEWSYGLMEQGIFVYPEVWAWDVDQQLWRLIDELQPNQPVLIYVEGGGASYLPLQTTEFTYQLHPGWNLLAVPEELPMPDGVRAAFVRWQDVYQRPDGNNLMPGKAYWLFWDKPAENFP